MSSFNTALKALGFTSAIVCLFYEGYRFFYPSNMENLRLLEEEYSYKTLDMDDIFEKFNISYWGSKESIKKLNIITKFFKVHSEISGLLNFQLNLEEIESAFTSIVKSSDIIQNYYNTYPDGIQRLEELSCTSGKIINKDSPLLIDSYTNICEFNTLNQENALKRLLITEHYAILDRNIKGYQQATEKNKTEYKLVLLDYQAKFNNQNIDISSLQFKSNTATGIYINQKINSIANKSEKLIKETLPKVCAETGSLSLKIKSNKSKEVNSIKKIKYNLAQKLKCSKTMEDKIHPLEEESKIKIGLSNCIGHDRIDIGKLSNVRKIAAKKLEEFKQEFNFSSNDELFSTVKQYCLDTNNADELICQVDIKSEFDEIMSIMAKYNETF